MVHKAQQNEHSPISDLSSNMASMYEKLRVEKEALVNLLCRQSIMCLEKRLSNEIKMRRNKNESIKQNLNAVEAQQTKSTSNRNVKESILSHRQTPQKGSSCLGRAKKKLFHPDVEPDDDDDEEEEEASSCNKVRQGLRDKMFGELQNKAKSKCRPNEQPSISKFPSKVTPSPNRSPHEVFRKRKLDENDNVMSTEKRPKLDLLDVSIFEPRACSTPCTNKFQRNSPFFRLPPRTQMLLPDIPCPPSAAKLQEDSRVNMPRILTIEDFSQANESYVASHLPINKSCNRVDAENDISMEDDDVNESIERVDSDASEGESRLNRTFTISPNKDSSSTMFSFSSSTQFEIPVIDSLSNSPMSPQKIPRPRASASRLTSEKQSDEAKSADSASGESTSYRIMTRSLARCHLSNPKNSSISLNETFFLPGDSKNRPVTSKTTLPNSTLSQEKEEIELLDWCVILNGSSFQLSGYTYNIVTKKCIKVESSTVVKRHRASLVETSDRKLYRLMNRFVKSRSNISDASQYFQNGFPENWKQVLEELVDRRTKMPENRSTKNVTSANEAKRQKKSLNSSFFDLPDGKGTPETPLRREDLRQTRKSGRHVVPPLAYWKNQRIMIDPRTNETLIIDGGKNFLDTKVVHFVG